MIELRQEISKYLENLTGNKYDAKSEILVTVGGSEAFEKEAARQIPRV